MDSPKFYGWQRLCEGKRGDLGRAGHEDRGHVGTGERRSHADTSPGWLVAIRGWKRQEGPSSRASGGSAAQFLASGLQNRGKIPAVLSHAACGTFVLAAPGNSYMEREGSPCSLTHPATEGKPRHWEQESERSSWSPGLGLSSDYLGLPREVSAALRTPLSVKNRAPGWCRRGKSLPTITQTAVRSEPAAPRGSGL